MLEYTAIYDYYQTGGLGFDSENKCLLYQPKYSIPPSLRPSTLKSVEGSLDVVHVRKNREKLLLASLSLSVCLSVCLSVRMVKFGFYLTDFHEI